MIRTLFGAAAIASIATASSAQFLAGNPLTSAVTPTASWAVELEDVVTIPDSDFSSPRIENLVSGGAPGRAYVIDQRGPIWSFDPSAPNPQSTLEEFFNVYDVVPDEASGNQRGLRGLAFHPDFNTPGAAGEGKFYTSLSRNAFSPRFGTPGTQVFFPAPGSVNHDSILAEWTVGSNGAVQAGPYRHVVGFGQPFDDHNIGEIGFNPLSQPGDADYGLLYIGLGDGGNQFPANPIDPFNTGSSLNTPLGSIVRIDPLQNGSDAYSIPSDNPFRVSGSVTESRNLIWAYGLRNPHNFAWDPVSGKMLIADIGQANIEEINLGAAGANYGWDSREGTFETTPFFSGFGNGDNRLDTLPPNHPVDSLTYPVAQYDHDLDNDGSIDSLYAVAGGSVYRGDIAPELRGYYFFGDFAQGNEVYAVPIDELVQRENFTNLTSLSGGRLAPYEEVLFTDGALLFDYEAVTGSGRTNLRFGEGPDGELYFLNKADGVIRRVRSVLGKLAGDFNEDGVVNAADYTVWRDLEGERYDGRDYDLWADEFGSSAPSESATVPEPMSFTLAAAAALLAARRRQG